MARLFQSGFELNSLTTGVEGTLLVTGTPTAEIVTSPVHGGTYAFHCAPSGNEQAEFNFNSFTAQGAGRTYYARTYFRFAALPSTTAIILALTNSGFTKGTEIKVTTGGVLQLAKFSNDAQIDSNSISLKANNWYRVEISHDYTNATATALLDGVQFASGATDATSANNTVTVGNTLLDTSSDFYFDDIAVNDDQGTSQNSYPGDGKIIHLKPSAAGDINGFAVQVGGTAGSANNFTRVNENTPDDATSYNGAALLNAEDLFNCDNPVIGAFVSINVVAVGARMADLVAGDATSGVKLEVLKTAGGTKSQSASIVPNSTSWVTNSSATAKDYPLVTYNDPDGLPWGQASLDSMQIGYINSAVGVQTIAISTVWVSVDFTPAPVGGTTTSTSSTSISSTSSSISSTSSSTSSTSISTSSTSTSTSTSSTSFSTSSTSSSTSSTSSSTSSTSTSSTSSSTSISSTSSSMSSTSFSSTSTSSTSQSTSRSSTSSSISSTSSSTSSTSASTSSTSVSTSSTSSSTSTTAIPLNLDYTYEDDVVLNTNNANLLNTFTSVQVGDVGGDDGDYWIQTGSKYLTSKYKKDWTNNTDTIVFTWRGRSTISTLVSPILIQIYNQNSSTWETLARETRVPADTDFQLQVTQTANLSNYYDSKNIVTFRSYQQVN